jgi:hypothetical protein
MAPSAVFGSNPSLLPSARISKRSSPPPASYAGRNMSKRKRKKEDFLVGLSRVWGFGVKYERRAMSEAFFPFSLYSVNIL